MELTGKYAGMIEALECDFSLAADPESEHGLDELQVKIENGDKRMLTDFELLSELSYGIRHGAIRIIGQPRSEMCVPTAFDLQSVIEQLEEHFNATDDKSMRLAYHHALEIVKSGSIANSQQT